MSFTVYRSSAGSGKTYTLVKEYLKIVLRDPHKYRRILAITFTNKAANEMRLRIVQALTELSYPEKHPDSGIINEMLPNLMEACKLQRPAIIKNAAKVLTLILHNYQDFSVSTIDSFIHRVVRTFAFDLHLPLNFEVEVDEDTMVGMAVDMLLSRVGIEKELTKSLSEFTEARIADEKNWDIEKDLKKFSKRLLKDDIADFLPGLLSMDSKMLLETSKKINALIKDFEKKLTALANVMMELWNTEGLSVDDFSYKKSGIFGFIEKLVLRKYDGLESPRARSVVEKDAWYSAKASSDTKAQIEGCKTKMNVLLDEIINFIDTGITDYKKYSILKKNIYSLAVISEIEKFIVQIRENDGIIHISELDKKIADVVNNEPVPFIYERLGEKYQHFLIDEFQDTSVLEWQNILPLVENSLAFDQFNMIVGDAKQAIYRFKGGDVEQLVQLPGIYKKQDSPEMDSREKALQRTYKPELLKYNFRSGEGIINFNNDLYAFIKEKLPDTLKLIYDDFKQEMLKPKAGGAIRINFIDEGDNVAEREPLYYEKILGEIKSLTENAGFGFRDIAILTRSNANASKIARYLLQKGVDVVSAESLLLKSSPEVNFLVNCLDYIDDTNNKLALTYILNFLEKQDPKSDLNDLLGNCVLPGKEKHESRRKALFDYLKDRIIPFYPDELRQMGLYERVEAIIRCFSLNTTPDPYIIFFLDIVLEFTRQNRIPIEEFTNNWREKNDKYSIVVPEGMDAVMVMTIHKAKGLEFPVVIYPFANNMVRIRNEQKWTRLDDPELSQLKTVLLPVNKQLEGTEFEDIYSHEQEMALLDLLNLLYVATTRPTQKLFIICDLPDEKENIKHIPSILRKFLESKDMWQEGIVDYSWGEAIPPEKKKEDSDAASPEMFISSDWRKNIMLSGQAANYWDLKDDARNLEWGKLVHDVLAKIDGADELENVIINEVVQGIISEDKAFELLKLLKDMLAKPEIKAFFDGSYIIKNEASVLELGGKEFRPDRLMIEDDKVIVLDYKTGKEEAKHKRQLEQYGKLMSEIGFKEVEMYLLYLDKEVRLLKV